MVNSERWSVCLRNLGGTDGVPDRAVFWTAGQAMNQSSTGASVANKKTGREPVCHANNRPRPVRPKPLSTAVQSSESKTVEETVAQEVGEIEKFEEEIEKLKAQLKRE